MRPHNGGPTVLCLDGSTWSLSRQLVGTAVWTIWECRGHWGICRAHYTLAREPTLIRTPALYLHSATRVLQAALPQTRTKPTITRRPLLPAAVPLLLYFLLKTHHKIHRDHHTSSYSYSSVIACREPLSPTRSHSQQSPPLFLWQAIESFVLHNSVSPASLYWSNRSRCACNSTRFSSCPNSSLQHWKVCDHMGHPQQLYIRYQARIATESGLPVW